MSLIDEGFWDLEYQTLKPRYNIASAATLYKEESYTDRYGGFFVSSSLWCSHTIEKGDFLMQRNNVYSRSYKLVLVALMIAMTLIINRVFPATPVYHISVDFIPVFIVAVIFGPLCSALTYALADAIGATLFPVGPFNPGITFTLFLLGLAFGLVFYKKDLSGKLLWLRSLLAAAISLLIKLLGTTYFLYLTFGGPNGMGYFAYVISRIPNCVIFAALVFVLLPIIQRVIVVRIIK